MNRTRRKAIKMAKRKYGKATNPYWQCRVPAEPMDPDLLRDAMRQLYAKCRPHNHRITIH